MSSRFWRIKNEAESAEMTLYGEISDRSWYGDEITPKQFADDLKSLGGKNLTVAINSGGGDVFAAQAIYNQLKNYTGKVSVRIDGICASAATIVACAGDTVVMPANAIYMIHNPVVAVIDYLGADDARKIAERLDTVKDSIIAVYDARLNGALESKKIAKLMDAETWMDAETAKNYGFIDEITPDLNVRNSLNGGILSYNGVAMSLEKYKNIASLSEIFAKIHEKTPKKGVKPMNEKTVLDKIKEMLGMDSPAAESQIDVAAVERERIAALDAMKDGRKNVEALIETAKAQGKTADEIKPFVDAMPQEKDDTSVIDAIKALIADNLKSGAESVKAAPQETAIDEAAQKMRNIEEIANLANKVRGLN